MNDELNGFLDSGLEADLPVELKAEAEAWERLLDNLRQDIPGPAPAWLEGRVMAEVRELARAGGDEPVRFDAGGRRRGWLLRPRTFRMSPVGLGLAAAAALALAAGPWLFPGGPGGGPAPEGTGTTAAVVYVQFVFEAPGATSVAVSGDFNEWDRDVHRLEDLDGDGVWTGRVPLTPGIHEYMFVVDGDRWVTDPEADRYADDGFGNRNAVLAVPGPDRT